MSNTRHAPPGSTLNQNRFASSPDVDRGLLGNLVALKCASIEAAEDRELILWVQGISHTQDGLAGLAAEVRKRCQSGKPVPAKETESELKAVEREMATLEAEETQAAPAILAAEQAERDAREDGELCAPEHLAALSRKARREHRLLALFRRHTALENELGQSSATGQSDRLPEQIAELCLNPAIPVADGWPASLPNLVSILRDIKAAREAQAESTFAHTELSRTLWREFDDTHEMGGAALLHNSNGIGKSCAAKAYCDAHPGKARYVNTPATNDDVGLLRAIGETLGVGAGLSFKAVQIRARILAMLGKCRLLLVLDSAQWLFPVSDYRYALPNRINWVLTALAESGVPVVMIGDTKLFDTLGLVEARTGWNRSKFVNQIGRVVALPEALAKEDVQAVAAALLPDGDRAAQRKLADFMIVAQGYLHSGQPAAQRARRIAAAHRRATVTLADISEAIDTRMVPAFKSMTAALERADQAAARCGSKGRSWRPDTAAQTAAKQRKRKNEMVTSSDLAAARMVGHDRTARGSRPSADALPESGSVVAEQDFSHPRGSRRGVPVGQTADTQAAEQLA